MIDLRSDTVTLPSEGMRAAMERAPVGDDQYGEDPTLNALQERVADLLGKEAALFMPTGTMANQVALRTLTRHGDDVLVGGEAHILWHETGAGAALSGVQLTAIGATGLFTEAEFRRACKPRGHIVFPPTTLVVIENTHNRGGGIIFPQEEAAAIARAADALGVATYLDGARLFNVAVATGRSLAELSKPFRLVSVALSKGLGCPAGSVLAGSREDMVSAKRIRRMYGGAMRQAGILGAAGLYALEHNIERLAEDHENARAIAEVLKPLPGVALDMETVQTNMVVFRTLPGAPGAAGVVARAREKGILVSAFAEDKVRVATHLDVSAGECREAAAILAECITSPRA